jgi:hypothetical protein
MCTILAVHVDFYCYGIWEPEGAQTIDIENSGSLNLWSSGQLLSNRSDSIYHYF